ncbi:MAG: thioesterase II family protein [Planctomycetota bacterium]
MPRPRARVVCLPCAGGAATMYREWSELLPDCDVLAAQLPGREHRVREQPLRDMETVLGELSAALAAVEAEPGAAAPLVLFGHSLGALVAFLLARRLDAAGRAPTHLIAAGARAPHRRPRRLLHDLPLAQLLDEVVRMGGTSPRVLAEPELLALIEPPLRADLWLAETNAAERTPPLPVSITALGGSEDVQIQVAEIEAWREVAGAACDVRFVRGGHFFVRDARAEVLDHVRAALPA